MDLSYPGSMFTCLPACMPASLPAYLSCCLGLLQDYQMNPKLSSDCPTLFQSFVTSQTVKLSIHSSPSCLLCVLYQETCHSHSTESSYQDSNVFFMCVSITSIKQCTIPHPSVNYISPSTPPEKRIRSHSICPCD